MLWEHRIAVRNMLKKVRDLCEDRVQHDHGEIDFMLLSSLMSNKKGWLGMVLQSLHSALSHKSDSEAASLALEETAGILIAWAAQIRGERLKNQKIPQSGERVYVRIPDSNLSWLGVVLDNGFILIDALNKALPYEEVEIIQNPVQKRNSRAVEQQPLREEVEAIFRKLRISL